jgi:hypothetical protein
MYFRESAGHTFAMKVAERSAALKFLLHLIELKAATFSKLPCTILRRDATIAALQ